MQRFWALIAGPQASLTLAGGIAETSGTWTPADASGAGLSLTVSYAKWRRHGNLMHIEAAVTYPATASGAAASWSGLPVASLNTTAGQIISNGAGAPHAAQVASTSVSFLAAGGTAITNANLTGAVVYLNATYSV